MENVKPTPVVPTPSLPEVNKEDNKKDNVTEVKLAFYHSLEFNMKLVMGLNYPMIV